MIRVRAISLSVTLGIGWLLLSGHYSPLMLSFGIASVALVVWLAIRMRLVDEEGHPVQLVPRVLWYGVYLLVQIVRANVDVIGQVLRPRLAISPTLVEVEATQSTDVGRVLYANSITLTPGTVAIEVWGHRIKVHALSRDGAEELATGAMGKRAAAVETRAR